jgi:hypothetical protein
LWLGGGGLADGKKGRRAGYNWVEEESGEGGVGKDGDIGLYCARILRMMCEQQGLVRCSWMASK